ncbi:uncharacterized protein EI97DRAFT_78533 [Westerdykella ornata]|uniref:Uncharacterized protein n=1 Tax=Westerdykella ornata TaxID=318751 RepID=A0A6A6JHM8_WESOR|nr:uncharacterized protein EI97DRAFT_78533 [Westerdykella ornata]KAF2275146.1 hypothetical protein EI97DRAFT_78533 [Westerdykella ornata]
MDHRHHAHRHRHSRRETFYPEIPGIPSRTTAMDMSPVQLMPRSTCTDPDAPECRKPTQIPTLPIVLGVVIPLGAAAIVLIYLHRRHIRKLREEDAKDKYKSLDFGVDPSSAQRKKGAKGMEMSKTDGEKSARHGYGISLDMGSPYIMPAGLNASRESFHSLSRSMHDPSDPYSPVTMSFMKGDNASLRSVSRNGGFPAHDNGSVYTTSSGATDRMNNGLLKNASSMSHSVPPRGEPLSPDREVPELRFPEPVAQPRSPSPLNPNAQSPPSAVLRTTAASPPPAQTQYVAFNPTGSPAVAPAPAEPEPEVQESKAQRTTPSPPPLRIQSQAAVLQNNTASFISDSSYGDAFQITPPSPPRSQERVLSQEAPLVPEPLHPQTNAPVGLGVEQIDYSANRLSLSLRPLPPDDPNDNPEQRALRIRSFYKEYFDESKPDPAGGHAYHDDYYEDSYGSEYLDGAVYDPQSNAFVVAQPHAPFAQPVTRRAMTPPPRAPPRFRSGSLPRGPHMSKGSMSSAGRHMPPRGMSSMSGRFPGTRPPPPPPAALTSLPTPSKLKEDSMVFNPIDFAPPVSIRERQNGMRPDSPLGTPRPYSPAVRAHTPLASAFDDLAVMPSPHMLRKSGTFTALDFAPPPRFRDPGSGASDAGSIRSYRSGISAVGRMAVRTGANRVSRIPKGVVGTKEDIVSALRPQMSLVAPA